MTVRSTGLLALVAVALVASACTGSSDDPVSGPGSTGGAPAPGGTAPAPSTSTIAFVSTDGSAFSGSRTVLTVTDAATGSSFLVPVDGSAGDTRAEIEVRPGTYTITSDQPHVSPTASYVVRDLAPTEVTVEATTDSARPGAIVEFGLEVQRAPFELRLADVSDARVELTWASIGDVEVSGYALRRTDGPGAAGDPADGVEVELAGPAATSAVAAGLQPETEYTFTLFATAPSGDVLAFRSVSATTASSDGSAPSFALAPNTITPNDLAALDPQVLGTSLVGVTLTPGNDDRASATAIPGIDPAVLERGCAVGMPILVSTDVAGDLAFYGLVESCQVPLASKAAQEGGSGSTAVVNTDVPLAAVVPFLSFRSARLHGCHDASGEDLGPDAPLCRGTDTDGDGIDDTTESALGLDPADPAVNGDSWVGPAGGAARPEAPEPPPVTDLEPPAGLGTGDVQVTLLWASGDDLDLYVTDPAGTEISYRAPSSPSGGRLDRDDLGDRSCQSTETRAENVFWRDDAPAGTYVVRVEDFLGGASASACRDRPRARLEVRVDGVLRMERTITVGVDGPVTFAVPDDPLVIGAVELPAGLGTGDVQVTVLWSEGDDVQLQVTDPAGDEVPRSGTPSPSGGVLDHADGGGPCGDRAPRAENVSWADGAPPGTYSVEVDNLNGFPCLGDHAEAWLEVRVRGELVIRQAIVIPRRAEDVAPYTFTVAAAPDRGRAPTSDPSTATGPGASKRAAAAQVSCESTGSSTFDPGFGFAPFHDVAVTLKWGALQWDIEAGATAYVDPTIAVEAGYGCSLDVDGVTFQLTTTPVPINLELAPVLEGSATGTFELTGPRLELAFGLRSEGSVDATMETCGWFETPCGVDLDAHASAEPIGRFSHGPATARVQGELSLGVGIDATLGVGIKNAFVTAKSGFALGMQPLVGRLGASASVGTPTPGSTAPPATAPAATGGPAERSDSGSAGGPPYDVEHLTAIRALEAEGAPVVEGVAGPRPLVGPRDGGGCYDGAPPSAYRALQDGRYTALYLCPDARCLDGGNPTPVYTDGSACAQAQCYVGGQVVSSGTPLDGVAECLQAAAGPPASAPPATPAVPPTTGPGGTAADVSLCAGVSVGGQLTVDLRAEAFVLGWGEDERYTIWEGEYAYPGGSFEIGTCD